jgi:minor extracellular serine protease Vpr
MPTPVAALCEITLKQVRVNKRQFPAHIFLENFWIFAMNQKIENVLALALQTPEPVREKSLNLNVGFTEETRTWELIVKYNGNLSKAVSGLPVTAEELIVEELIAGYGLLTVPEDLVDTVSRLPQIEYVEKPKRLFFSMADGKEVSCVLPVTKRQPFLSGKGILLAVIDSGIDYTNRNFRNADGSTRILSLWDQTVSPDAEKGFFPPEGFQTGTEFTREQINAALREADLLRQYELVPSRDSSGHGTAVAGIAAGTAANVTGGTANNNYEGVAPESELLIVKLGTPRENSFPRTTEMMRAVTYVVRKAQSINRPVAINLSFGNTYGAHDGSSLLERFLDNAAEIGRTVICVGSGNEGTSAGHREGRVNVGETAATELSVGAYETAFSVQLWKTYTDVFRITLRSPGGQEFSFSTEKGGEITWEAERTRILIYVGEPSPYAVEQEIYFDFIPENLYISPGIWSFLIGTQEKESSFYFYLPSQAARNQNTRFFEPNPNLTLTIPSTASKVITVGAYDSTYDAYADFSGRGYRYAERDIGLLAAGAAKPDLAAPGVNITAPDIYGGYRSFTGTSFATPFVTGAAALLMEWGIVQGNDAFLYGEKVKAYLRRGARKIRGEEFYPNDRVGYGALCVADSIPR